MVDLKKNFNQAKVYDFDQARGKKCWFTKYYTTLLNIRFWFSFFDQVINHVHNKVMIY